MPKIIMTKGLPGSGKTFWAKKYQAQDRNVNRVNKDDLRAMIHDSVHTGLKEGFIIGVRDQIVRESLKRGHNIIVDDTNFNPKHEESLRAIAKEFEGEFEIKDFTDVSVDQCIQNDLKRVNSVGKDVIMKMYDQHLKPKSLKIEKAPGLPDIILCDLDGTLALFEGSPYDRDFSKDILNEPIAEILRAFRGTKIAILSGRNDRYKEMSVKWLNDQGVIWDHMFMRKNGDSRKDWVVKQEMYEAAIKDKFNVLFILDDRNQVVDLWRSLGLTCLQVAPGDF